MFPELKERIEAFTKTFSGYVDCIDSVSFGDGGERYRKVLYFTILEGLAHARYRGKKRAGSAVGSFVVTCCDWADGDRVSLPHLVAALKCTSDSSFFEARDATLKWYTSWRSDGPLPLTKDPLKSQVQSIWPRTSEGGQKLIPEFGVTWEAFQHRALLYSYRSKLSHEAREQSLSFNDRFGSMPHYNSVQRGDDPLAWHLAYPSDFLRKLCCLGISALESYCVEELYDPHLSFTLGYYLIDKLNRSAP